MNKPPRFTLDRIRAKRNHLQKKRDKESKLQMEIDNYYMRLFKAAHPKEYEYLMNC